MNLRSGFGRVLLKFFGGHKAVVRPDPIPNSAVKHSLADGSSPIGSARVGSRQSFKKAGELFSPAFLLLLNSLRSRPLIRWRSNPFAFNDFCALLVCQVLEWSGSSNHING
jgi:hypothetical protein